MHLLLYFPGHQNSTFSICCVRVYNYIYYMKFNMWMIFACKENVQCISKIFSVVSNIILHKNFYTIIWYVCQGWCFYFDDTRVCAHKGARKFICETIYGCRFFFCAAAATCWWQTGRDLLTHKVYIEGVSLYKFKRASILPIIQNFIAINLLLFYVEIGKKKF